MFERRPSKRMGNQWGNDGKLMGKSVDMLGINPNCLEEINGTLMGKSVDMV